MINGAVGVHAAGTLWVNCSLFGVAVPLQRITRPEPTLPAPPCPFFNFLFSCAERSLLEDVIP